MRKLRENKKGQFWSLTGVLLVVLIAVILRASISAVDEERAFRVDRAQTSMMDSFARNFETLDVPLMLETAARLSLQDLSASSPPANSGQLLDLMRNGGGSVMRVETSTTRQFSRIQATLGFADNEPMTFSYDLVDVRQIDPFSMILVFDVDYVLISDEQRWQGTDVRYEIEVPLAGMIHPGYDPNLYDTVIANNWDRIPGPGCVGELLLDPALFSSCQGGDISPPGWVAPAPPAP